MEMHQIRYFLAVIQTLHFTRAADQCNVSQPSLTRAIKRLEEEFGGLLFNRKRAQTHLTELGRTVLPHLQQIYEASEAATSLATSIGRAEVTPLVIGVANGLSSPLLDEILGSLSVALPGLEIDLRAGTSEHLIEASLKGGIDLLLIVQVDHVPDRIEIWPLFVQRYGLATRADHPLALDAAPSLADVIYEKWIDCSDEGTTLWRKVMALAGHDAAFGHRADSRALARRLILLGLGCAILPTDAQGDGIMVTEFGDHALGVQIMMGAVAGRRRGHAADAFVREARSRDWKIKIYQTVGASTRTAEVHRPITDL